MNDGAGRLALIAAGGTGGHLFAAEALAAALKEKGFAVELATDSRAAAYAKQFPARAIHVLPADTVRGGLLSLFKTALLLGFGTLRALILLLRIKPAVVAGFGGYPTFPPVVAAWLLRIPRVIHEQNAVMGRANRLLAPLATKIGTGYPNLLASTPSLASKSVHVGNPVRAAVKEAAGVPYEPLSANGALRLLVFGGSQGARVMSEVVPAGIERLAPDVRSRIQITQQCRPEDMDQCRAIYQRIGVKADLASFFDDLPARIARNHLVIARSGAGTVAELAVLGRPSILVPLPHALDQDQLANASALAAAGGALLIRQDDFSADRLAKELTRFAAEPAMLSALAAAAKRMGRADAAERLAAEVARVAL
jgi:UDP-N-acetylglucosamine--N-acetylmuramyl-(pentapeptide) pyrophosphoryl-undecaprenol N-acetylglucosamine transferase